MSATNRIANGADLIVKVVAVASDPSGLAAAGTVASGWLNLGGILDRKKPLCGAHAGMADELRERLRKPDFVIPPEGEILLPQMIEIAEPSAAEVIAAGREADALLDAMLKSLDHRRDYRDEGLRKAFKAWVRPPLKDLLEDATFREEHAPEINAAVLVDVRSLKQATEEGFAQQKQDSAELKEMLGELLRQKGGGSAALADPEALSLEELQALAANFGEAEGATKAELIGVIETKRQEHEAFVAEINAINEQTAGLGNLKAAARAAADNLDYAEVEKLLARVDEVETEIAAQTKELRADNALLRGRVEEAYRLLSAAAESFGSVDPVEPARKRHDYMQRLYFHGLRYGGSGLALANQMILQAIATTSEKVYPSVWAMCQNARGAALADQGSRTGGEAGAALLAEAVAAYRAALRVRTEAEYPVGWAGTENNLGTALWSQGSRTGGEAGAALLAEAVAAYRAALRVRTEAAHPVDWAGTQNNLGNALRNQGSRTGGEAGAALLAEAVAAYRAALRVYTETEHPVDWAMTTENIALAEESVGAHETCDDPAPHLRAALEAATAALRVYDPEHMPYDHGTATELEARLEAKLAELAGGSDQSG